jgi:hemoglobin
MTVHIGPARPVSRDITSGNDVGVLVYRFYRRAIPDPLLGPVFEGFGVDWPRHLPRLVAYWEHVLLDRPGSATNTVGVHAGVQNAAPFGQAHIDRWVELWETTVDELYAGPVADLAKARAHQVGRALQAVSRRRQTGGFA